MPEKLSAKEAAIQLGTNARTLRKFLRSSASSFDAVGQGNRYEFTAGQVKKMKKEFATWGKGTPDEKKPFSEDSPAKKELLAQIQDELDAIQTDDEEELPDPTDEELAAIEDELEIEEIDIE